MIDAEEPASLFTRVNINTHKVIFTIALLLCLFPFVSPPVALLMGLILAQVMENPYAELSHQATHWLLQVAVVGLGFGMNVFSAIQAGREGVLFTVFSIILVFTVGLFAGKYLKIDKKTSFLISAGTAICGGSAIAALSPVIKAGEKQISVALGAIFILNSIALFVFPLIGHSMRLSQSQFGLWCAIAIHDTSSVVGAASHYGAQALQVATTVKLARALWIIPVAFITAAAFKTGSKNVKLPYFIGFFILAMLLNTYIPAIKPIIPYITGSAKIGLTVTLFLIGTSLPCKLLRSIGIVPLLQAVMLWVLISALSLWAIIGFS
ncbi:MAG: putative sulfate exporter family transporter [Bacteroidota bacterium]|nr:putative sulfate exporter family transporter [Bacteroidota bacterium]